MKKLTRRQLRKLILRESRVVLEARPGDNPDAAWQELDNQVDMGIDPEERLAGGVPQSLSLVIRACIDAGLIDQTQAIKIHTAGGYA